MNALNFSIYKLGRFFSCLHVQIFQSEVGHTSAWSCGTSYPPTPGWEGGSGREIEMVQNQNIHSMCYGGVHVNWPYFGILNTQQQFGPEVHTMILVTTLDCYHTKSTT